MRKKTLLMSFAFFNVSLIQSSQDPLSFQPDPSINVDRLQTDRLFTSSTEASIEHISTVIINQIPQPSVSRVFHHNVPSQQSLIDATIQQIPAALAMAIVQYGMQALAFTSMYTLGWVLNKLKTEETKAKDEFENKLMEQHAMNQLQQQQHLKANALMERIQELQKMHDAEPDEAMRIVWGAQIRELKNQLFGAHQVSFTEQEVERLQALQSAA